MGLLDALVDSYKRGMGLLAPTQEDVNFRANMPGLIADFTPVIGDAKSVYDGVQSARQGDWMAASLNGIGALPFVPSLFGMTKRAPYMGKKISNLAYQIEHKPMTIAGGAAGLHDVERVFGPDIFGKNALQYFGSGGFDKQEKEAIDLMRKVKGNPDAMVTVYRGVPDGVTKINPGDWVALTPDIASEYGNVLKMQVPAREVTSWPDSLVEFGWHPSK